MGLSDIERLRVELEGFNMTLSETLALLDAVHDVMSGGNEKYENLEDKSDNRE